MTKDKDQRLEAKYRPKDWDGYVGNKDIVEKLRTIENKGFGEMPCLLFSGEPGCGKSLAAEILMRNLKKKTRYLIVNKTNASNSRGIDDIRALEVLAKRANPQIIFMDEFDEVTSVAQAALRVVMEDEAYDNTRWIISCNNSEKILPAIKSRCAVFRFENHSQTTILLFLDQILRNEDAYCDADADEIQVAMIELIESRSFDLRGCVNQLSTILAEDGKLTVQGVVKRIPVERASKIIKIAYDGDLKEAIALLNDVLVQKNHRWRALVDIWYDTIVKTPDADHAKRMLISLSEYENRCVRGSNPRNHLVSFLAFVSILKHLGV